MILGLQLTRDYI